MIENVLRDNVVPLARHTATLLLVIDALSMAAANELVTAMQRDGWTEIAAGEGTHRASALAVLPTLTQRSRCSLLCGELREGADTVERSGFLALLKEAGLQARGGVPDPIFHKSALDAIPSGASLATDVNNAIADTENQRLVAAVLNYVDDTLHHTDPGGTDWTIGTITHLRALLQAAKSAGRAVVITSDHGHIIEYGTSAKAERANIYGQRAHGDVAGADPVREVVIEGHGCSPMTTGWCWPSTRRSATAPAMRAITVAPPRLRPSCRCWLSFPGWYRSGPSGWPAPSPSGGTPV